MHNRHRSAWHFVVNRGSLLSHRDDWLTVFRKGLVLIPLGTISWLFTLHTRPGVEAKGVSNAQTCSMDESCKSGSLHEVDI